jgi:PGF-pre-PGF domain-containing protein
VTNTWDVLEAGKVNKWTGLLLTSGSITEIWVEVLSNVTSTYVQVREISKPTSITDEPGESYQYYDIRSNAESSKFKSIKIFFSVPASWIDDNDLTVDDIYMYRWTGTSWQKLDTSKESSTSTTKKFSAISPGLSYFSVFGVPGLGGVPALPNLTDEDANETAPEEEDEEPVVVVEQPEEEAAVNQTGQPFQFPDIPWVPIVVVVVVAVGAFFAYKFLKGRRGHVPSGPKRIIVRRV